MRKLITFLSVFFLLAACLSFFSAGAQADGHDTYPSQSDTLQIGFDNISPATLNQGQNLTVTAHVKNLSPQAQANVHISFKFSPRLLVSRTQVDNWSQGHEGSMVLGTQDIASLAPQENKTVEFSVNADQFTPFYDDWGTRGISVDATLGDKPDINVLSSSFIVLNPTDQYQPTALVPLIQLSSQLSGNITPGTIPSQDALFAKGQQYDNLLQTAGANPFSVASDAALIQSATDSQDPVTKAWLEGYKGLKNEIVNVPPFTPDVMAAARVKQEPNYAAFVGKIKGAAQSDPRGINNIIMPAQGAADPSLLNKIMSAQDTIMIDSQNFTSRNDITYTPDALTSVSEDGGNYNAIVQDHQLSTLLANIGVSGNQTLDQQRFLAETATITREQPQTTRNIVFTAPENWNPNPAEVKGVMDALAGAPWVKFAKLQDVLNGTQNNAYGQLTYTDEQKKQELNPDLIGKTDDYRDQLLGFSKIVSGTSDLEHEGTIALGEVAGSSLRNTQGSQQAVFDKFKQRTEETLNSVQIVQTSNLNLLTNSADVKFLVVNKHNETVNLKIEATANNTKLSVEQPPPVTVEAYRQANVTVPLKAISNGAAVLTLQPEALDGQHVGQPVHIPVTLNISWGDIMTKIIVSIAGLLILFGIYRTIKKNLAKPKQTKELPDEF